MFIAIFLSSFLVYITNIFQRYSTYQAKHYIFRQKNAANAMVSKTESTCGG